MKVTLVSYGSMGDNLPLVALAVGLRSAGHQPVLVAEQHAADLAGSHQIEFHALAGDIDELMRPGGAIALTVEAGRLTAASMRGFRRADRAWLETITAAATGSDVVVGMPVAGYHALTVAADVGATPVIAELQPLAPTSGFAPAGLGVPRIPSFLNKSVGRLVDFAGWATIARAINRARRELNWQPSVNPTHGVLRLGGWSPTVVPRPDDWPPNAVVTGAWTLPNPPGWQPDPALQEFLDAGEPPIYVGFGSMPTFSGTRALMEAVTAGLAGHRVLLTGAATAAQSFVGRDVLAIGHVPHDWLLSRCAAVMHHSGAGTTHAAIASGTPSVPVPFTLDQPFWASRLHSLGVAPPPLDPRRPNGEAVRAAVRFATDSEVKRRALTLAGQIGKERGVDCAIKQLERCTGQDSLGWATPARWLPDAEGESFGS